MKAGTKMGDSSLHRKLAKMVRKGKRQQAVFHLKRLAPKRGNSVWNPGLYLGQAFQADMEAERTQMEAAQDSTPPAVWDDLPF